MEKSKMMRGESAFCNICQVERRLIELKRFRASIECAHGYILRIALLLLRTLTLLYCTIAL